MIKPLSFYFKFYDYIFEKNLRLSTLNILLVLFLFLAYFYIKNYSCMFILDFNSMKNIFQVDLISTMKYLQNILHTFVTYLHLPISQKYQYWTGEKTQQAPVWIWNVSVHFMHLLHTIYQFPSFVKQLD